MKADGLMQCFKTRVDIIVQWRQHMNLTIHRQVCQEITAIYLDFKSFILHGKLHKALVFLRTGNFVLI